jgi:hypothetical protein
LELARAFGLPPGLPGLVFSNHHQEGHEMSQVNINRVPCAWLWRFVDGAKSAGELYGRVMVVFAAQHYATQLVLASSQRRGPVLPRSHKDTARKAFERVAKRVLPTGQLHAAAACPAGRGALL